MSSPFASSREFREVIDKTFAMMSEDPEMGPGLRDANVPQRFEFEDLDLVVNIRAASPDEGVNLYWEWTDDVDWVGVDWLGCDGCSCGGCVTWGVLTVAGGSSVHWTEATRLAGAPVTLASQGMSPLALRVWPVVRVTVTVRLADAGTMEPPKPAVKPAAAIRLMRSFVLFIRAARLLPRRRPQTTSLGADPSTAREVPAPASYWAPPTFSTWNRSPSSPCAHACDTRCVQVRTIANLPDPTRPCSSAST